MTSGAIPEAPLSPALVEAVQSVGDSAFQQQADALRAELRRHLESQGFKLTPAGVIAPVETAKDKLRALHHESVVALRERGRAALAPKEDDFIARLADGARLNPSTVRPRLVMIDTYRHPDANVWRWCSLHWSIPVSVGYGRRLRFLVVDEGNNDAVMGLIGLADPVFSLGCRDAEINWTVDQRTARLTSVMDAFVLGAVPPYSNLLAGKLMAMLLTSGEVRETFAERYGHRRTLIAERDPNAQLALVTTSSALGRSSVYNRVRRRDGSLVLKSVGSTRGSGDFHFSGEIYEKLYAFASQYADATSRHEKWGTPGFRNRREVIQKALQVLELPGRALRFHGVQREVFLAPFASNSNEYLRGETDTLELYDETSEQISAYWRERWAGPRSKRDASWKSFEPETWRLYG